MCANTNLYTKNRVLKILVQLLKLTQVVSDPITEAGHMLAGWLETISADSPSNQTKTGWDGAGETSSDLMTSWFENRL